jgi:hypothetical protein
MKLPPAPKPARPARLAHTHSRPRSASAWSSMSSRARATRYQITALVDQDIEQLVIQLEAWRGRVDQLLGVNPALGASIPGMGDLTAKFGVARRMLDELRTAGGDRWFLFKPGIERAWHELEAALAGMVDGSPMGVEATGPASLASPRTRR